MSGACYSIVEYLGRSEGHHCGYCRDPSNVSVSHGMWAHHLDPQDYLDLIERGWRRSGRYCYRPLLQSTCCPQYTLRLQASKFAMSKGQKKLMKKFRSFLHQGKHDTRDPSDDNDPNDVKGDQWQSLESASRLVVQKNLLKMERKAQISNDKVDVEENTQKMDLVKETSAKSMDVNEAKGSKKAKLLRRERAKARLKDDFKSGEQRDKEKFLEDFLNFDSDSKHRFSIRTVAASQGDALFDATLDASHAVYVKYQTTIHKDTVNECNLKQFLRFLCNSSLSQQRVSPDLTWGAFHQQYLIDDRIFMVGVVDLLPRGLSSVYLYYDPDFAFLSPGSLSALFEIGFVRQIQRNVEANFDQYYMGFYIHSCPKMRYKANFRPSQLLCPFTLHWQNIEKAQPLMDESKCARLRHDVPVVQGEDSEKSADHALVLLGGHRVISFDHYCRVRDVGTKEIADVKQYVKLVGEDVAKRMLLYRKDRRPSGSDDEDD